MLRIRKAVVLLLMLAYTGQTLAALVLPCPKMAGAGAASDMADMVAMGHAGHHLAADSAAPSAPMAGDCCADGLCGMSHCQSTASLPLSHFHDSRHYVWSYHRVADAATPFHPRDSLYRPPISR